MKMGLYSKLAVDGIRKNKRLYIPYMLTGIVMSMMSYIIYFLTSSDMLEHMKGGGTLRVLLPVGSVVVAAFSLIFMFYSNSFLIRQRNREFGLYNVLGMDKGNLSRIMFAENAIVAGVSIVGGLVSGIAFSKLAELAMFNLINGDITYTMRIDVVSVGKTILLFGGIYTLLLLNSVIKVRRSSAIEMLKSSNVGEKPPKANWLFAIVGVVILGWAYYIALSIKQPLSAIVWFMLAVIVVIIATYLLFVSGSVAFCRMLQKNKKYYYKVNHFVSVSSMVYRMKRNGAGLASICILATIVLVMISSTLSLYVGAEDSLNTRYPHDIALRLSVPGVEYFNEDSFSHMRHAVDEKVNGEENVLEYSGVDIPGLFTDDGVIVDSSSYTNFNMSDLDNIGFVHIISLEEYNRLMGTNETLDKDECMLHCYRSDYSNDTFSIQNCETLKVKSIVDEMYVSGYAAMQVVPMVTVITSDVKGLIEPILAMEKSQGDSFLEFFWYYAFDMNSTPETKVSTYEKLYDERNDIIIMGEEYGYSCVIDCMEAEREEFYGSYGGLFFIGVLLSIVFIFATVLIIYYKQISEGFEDQRRFDVMQKVGMTKKEIRKSINSQVLTVFFLPLILAGLHLAVAFPILWKLLQLFNLTNMTLAIMVIVGCFLVFALVYAIVYKITSNAYYEIVSRGESA